MVEFRGVGKFYDNNSVALKNIDLNIRDGEFVFIVGPSGSGKSTLLKLISKEQEPTSGEIFVSGENITHLKKRKIPYMRRTMGIVFQEFRVIEKMTVFENVAFAMHVVGAGSREISRRVPYVLNLVGLSDKARKKVSELSGGEKQRVGLARALVNNPRMILADEPTGNIDPAMSLEILELLKQIADLDRLPKGAYNFRVDGKGVERNTTAEIDIVTKKDKPGIDIFIKPNTIGKSVHIPVMITKSGLDDLVYNDFYVGDNCDVVIVAGCGIYNCGSQKSEHDGIHVFHIGKNSKVRYIEKHLGIAFQRQQFNGLG